MNSIHQKIEIGAIDFSVLYSGYLWYSNASAPQILENEKISKETFSVLPFVAEAMLLSTDRKTSLSIKNIDAQYHAFQTDLSLLPTDKQESITYLSHRTPGFSKYQMIEYWEEQAAHGVEGFPTLQPAWSAFFGLLK